MSLILNELLGDSRTYGLFLSNDNDISVYYIDDFTVTMKITEAFLGKSLCRDMFE